MVESALFSVSIRLRNNLIAQKSHCLIETFNSFENTFIHKIEFQPSQRSMKAVRVYHFFEN